MSTLAIPKAFIWRRLHSLMGLCLVLFLIEHLLVNSQAAIWLGGHGRGFIELVNSIHNLPYLQAIEVTLLGIPILIHGVLGVKYALTSKSNVRSNKGQAPTIKTTRNRAYSWQRITSWLLLIGLVAHVTKFRFIDYPQAMPLRQTTYYATVISMDDGLYRLANRLNVSLYDHQAQQEALEKMAMRQPEAALVSAANSFEQEKYDWLTGPESGHYEEQKAMIVASAQDYTDDLQFAEQLNRVVLKKGQVLAVARDFGTASLLGVRNTFKVPLYAGLYTLFVLAACFHAFNGFWTFLLTWGWILKMSAQQAWFKVAGILMLGLIGLGLAAIWGTYWHGST